jgi:hypothetical protein
MKRQHLLIFLFSFGCMTLLAQESTIWDFPIKPGTDGWSKLLDHEMKVQACQMPESVLSSISTQNLIEICLNYPLLLNIAAFSSFQEGMNDFKKSFNGIVELYRRVDAPKYLIERYSNLSPKNLDPKWSSFEKGHYAFTFIALELILSQKALLSSLSNDELKKLLTNSLQKFDDKNSMIEIYDNISLRSLGYLLTTIILEADPDGLIVSSQDIKELNTTSNSTSMYTHYQLLKIISLSNLILHKL